jgi:hypothetical protein
MTPFPTLCLDHNNQALIKRFAYQGTRSDICVLPKPKSQVTRLKYTNGVMTSRIGRHYQPTLWDALKACACPCKLTLFASSFWGQDFTSPQSRSSILIWAYARSSICPMPNLTTLFAFIRYSRDTIFWKFLSLYFTCNLMWYILCDTLPH